MCSKEGFHQPTKTSKSGMVTTKAMPKARDGADGKKTEKKESQDKSRVLSPYFLEVNQRCKFEIVKFYDVHTLCTPTRGGFSLPKEMSALS